jgi:hypothetical protein
MKQSKRSVLKSSIYRSSYADDPVISVPLKGEAEQPKQGKVWDFFNNLLTTVNSGFQAFGRPQQPGAPGVVQVPSPAKNNTPIYVGIALVVLLLVGLAVIGKKS